jgi:hypothetical protein
LLALAPFEKSFRGWAVWNRAAIAMLCCGRLCKRYIALLESRASASAWFVGTNTLFNFESPAAVLRERGTDGRAEVVRAAKSFVSEALAASEGVEAQAVSFSIA